MKNRKQEVMSVIGLFWGFANNMENVENRKNEAKFVSRSLVRFRSLAP